MSESLAPPTPDVAPVAEYEAAPIVPAEQALGNISIRGMMEAEAPATQDTDPFAPGYIAPEGERFAEPAWVPHDRHDVAEQFLGDEIRRGVEYTAKEAMARSEFVPSGELYNGLKSYYESHYAMAGVIEMGMADPHQPEVTAEQQEALQQIVGSSIHSSEALDARVKSLVEHGIDYENPGTEYVEDSLPLLAAIRLARLRNPDDKRLETAELNAQLVAVEGLFAEVSVGSTTVGPKEIETVERLHGAVVGKIEDSGLFEQRNAYGLVAYSPKDRPHQEIRDNLTNQGVTRNIDLAQKMFWDDTRHAGQLLYHNTENFQSVWQNASIQPRRVQLERSGTLANHTTAKISRAYTEGQHHHSPTVHFSERFNPREYRGKIGTREAGTLAIPLAEVIKTTPYARNSEYGTLQLKPGSAAREKVAVHDGSGEIGWGSNDIQGTAGEDRTFYRSGRDATPDAPLAEAPDGYEYNFANTPMIRIALGEQEKENVQTLVWGTGENVPKTVSLDYDPSHAYEEKPKLDQQLISLQEKVIDQYPDQIVVPLRSGVMDFQVPDDGSYVRRPQSRFTRIDDPKHAEAA